MKKRVIIHDINSRIAFPSILSHRREHIMPMRKEKSTPHKHFYSSLNGLDVCKIQLEEVCLATSTFFEIITEM